MGSNKLNMEILKVPYIVLNITKFLNYEDFANLSCLVKEQKVRDSNDTIRKSFKNNNSILLFKLKSGTYGFEGSKWICTKGRI